MVSMICCLQSGAVAAQGDHIASWATAWLATRAAAFARRSAPRSSSWVSAPPPKSRAGLPPTFSRSSMRVVVLPGRQHAGVQHRRFGRPAHAGGWLGNRPARPVGPPGSPPLPGPPPPLPVPGPDGPDPPPGIPGPAGAAPSPMVPLQALGRIPIRPHSRVVAVPQRARCIRYSFARGGHVGHRPLNQRTRRLRAPSPLPGRSCSPVGVTPRYFQLLRDGLAAASGLQNPEQSRRGRLLRARTAEIGYTVAKLKHISSSVFSPKRISRSVGFV